MSITDELRMWAKGGTLRAGMSVRTARDQALAIADRIDAEHERKIGCTADEWDCWESTHVELPKDADGEHIHIGDVMDSRVDYLFDGKPFTVRALVLCEDGWEAADGRFGNRYEPDSLHHHHASTVEDVLREFAERYLDYEGVPSAGRRGIGEALMDEYAAKLRLADDGEEQ